MTVPVLSRLMNKRYTFEEAMASYKLRSEIGRRLLRNIASRRLVNHGCTEVGSSDINHELYAMFNEYNGDWDQCYIDALEDYSDCHY